MSNENVCSFNKYGFCKYGQVCRKRHIEKICEKKDCDIYSCESRHPRSCKFFMEFKRCKFGEYCRYLHKYLEHSSESNQIEAEFQTIKSKMTMIEQENKDLRKKIDEQSLEMENLNNKFLDINTVVEESLKKAIESIIAETTKTFTEIFLKRQDDAEKNNVLKFSEIQEQLATIAYLLKTTSSQSNSVEAMPTVKQTSRIF